MPKVIFDTLLKKSIRRARLAAKAGELRWKKRTGGHTDPTKCIISQIGVDKTGQLQGIAIQCSEILLVISHPLQKVLFISVQVRGNVSLTCSAQVNRGKLGAGQC